MLATPPRPFIAILAGVRRAQLRAPCTEAPRRSSLHHSSWAAPRGCRGVWTVCRGVRRLWPRFPPHRAAPNQYQHVAAVLILIVPSSSPPRPRPRPIKCSSVAPRRGSPSLPSPLSPVCPSSDPQPLLLLLFLLNLTFSSSSLSSLSCLTLHLHPNPSAIHCLPSLASSSSSPPPVSWIH